MMTSTCGLITTTKDGTSSEAKATTPKGVLQRSATFTFQDANHAADNGPGNRVGDALCYVHDGIAEVEHPSRWLESSFAIPQ
jgi:hypothetical protein